MKAMLSATCLAAVLLPVGSASATVPGTNGKIAFTSTRDGNSEIYVVDEDGSGEMALSNHPDDDSQPAWSPDGEKIAFVSNRDLYPLDQYPDLWIMNADGSGQVRLSSPASGVSRVEWFPDGSKIAYLASRCTDASICGMYSVSPEGGDITPFGACCFGPNLTWSPYGEPLAYTRSPGGEPTRIHTVNSDGSGDHVLSSDTDLELTALDWAPDARSLVLDGYTAGLRTAQWPSGDVHDVPGTSSADNYPTWSPDGTRFAFAAGFPSRIATIRTDGTDRMILTAGDDADPDWQPLNNGPFPQGYPRPKGATPVRISLVPAFTECATSWENRTHGPPLGHPACNPPQPLSPNLTIGTPDSNGAAPNSRGEVKLYVTPGNSSTPADEADVRVDTFVLDVRCRFTVVEDPETQGFPCVAGAMADYTGEIELLPRIRITDKLNGDPATRTGTVQDFDVPITVPCAATAESTIGATCSLSTTFDSIVPGMVTEGKRAIWALDRIHIHDAGVDGDAELNRPEQVEFMTQGVFVP